MGLANWLTLLRILLIPVFVTFLVYRRPGIALGVFCLASVTDLLDGYIARRAGTLTRLGAFLDPLADKLLLTASFVTLTWLRLLPFWITAVVVSRDLLLILGAVLVYMMGGRIHPSPTRAGKLSTFFQILVVLVAMLLPRFPAAGGALRILIGIATAFTVFSGLQYIVQGMRYLSVAHGTEPAPRETDFVR
jgi:cardiolipin synthase